MEFKEKKRWVFLGLPLSFTTYTITEEIVTIEQGFLNRKEDDCYMYKIQDVTLTTDVYKRQLCGQCDAGRSAGAAESAQRK